MHIIYIYNDKALKMIHVIFIMVVMMADKENFYDYPFNIEMMKFLNEDATLIEFCF